MLPGVPVPSTNRVEPRRSTLLPTVLTLCAIIAALAAAGYGIVQQRRTERVVVATRTIPNGARITSDDLGLIDVPLHRPQQLAGMTEPTLVVGQWTTREIGPNALLQPDMVQSAPPGQPVYPSGELLGADMVVLPISTEQIGPVTSADMLHIGYLDQTGDPLRCQAEATTLTTQLPRAADTDASVATTPDGNAQPYACRLLTNLNILWVDDAAKVAYVEVPPPGALAYWSLKAAGLVTWAERYGAISTPLAPLDRLDPAQITVSAVATPLTSTTQLGAGGTQP